MSCAPTLCAERTAEDESDSSVGMGMVCFDEPLEQRVVVDVRLRLAALPAMIFASTG